jgi:hypothetical protein
MFALNTGAAAALFEVKAVDSELKQLTIALFE